MYEFGSQAMPAAASSQLGTYTYASEQDYLWKISRVTAHLHTLLQ